MKRRNLAVMSVLVAVGLLGNSAHAMGSKRKEQEKTRAALKLHQTQVKEQLVKAEAEAKKAREKVSTERGSQAAKELQQTAAEVGEKSAKRGIEQALKPGDTRTAVKNTITSAIDAKKLGEKKSELTKATLDIIGVTDAQNNAAAASSRVRELKKELKATEKAIAKVEKTIKESSAKQKPSRKPQGGEHREFRVSEPRQIERDVIGGRDHSRVA